MQSTYWKPRAQLSSSQCGTVGGVSHTPSPLSFAQLCWVNSIGLCQNNGEFVLITALGKAGLQELAETNVGPVTLCTSTRQRALWAPGPLCAAALTGAVAKVTCAATCLLKTASRHPDRFHTRQTTFPTNWPWIPFKWNGKSVWASPAQVKWLQVCDSFHQALDRSKSLHTAEGVFSKEPKLWNWITKRRAERRSLGLHLRTAQPSVAPTASLLSPAQGQMLLALALSMDPSNTSRKTNYRLLIYNSKSSISCRFPSYTSMLEFLQLKMITFFTIAYSVCPTWSTATSTDSEISWALL